MNGSGLIRRLFRDALGLTSTPKPSLKAGSSHSLLKVFIQLESRQGISKSLNSLITPPEKTDLAPFRLPLHRRQQPHPSISGRSVFSCTPKISLDAFRSLNGNVNREYICAISRQLIYRRYFFEGRPAISVGDYFVYVLTFPRENSAKRFESFASCDYFQSSSHQPPFPRARDITGGPGLSFQLSTSSAAAGRLPIKLLKLSLRTPPPVSE